MAYSPEMLYAATGTSTASRTAAQHVEVGQRRLDHHEVGALGDVEQRLAHALADVAPGPAGRSGGRPGARSRRPRGTGRRRPRRTSPSRPGSTTSVCPAASRARGSPRPGRPSSRWARPGRRRRRPGRAPSRRTPRGCGRCRPHRRGSSTPQWPWSVNSSRHRSLITVSASPTSATTSVIARLRMPVGVDRAGAGRRPWSSGCRRASPRRARPRPPRPRPPAGESRVCWTTPGIEPIGAGSVTPSRDEHRQHQLAGPHGGLGDQAPQRRGTPQPSRRDGPTISASPQLPGGQLEPPGGRRGGWQLPVGDPRRVDRRVEAWPCGGLARPALRGLVVTGSPASSMRARRLGAEVGERVDERPRRRASGRARRPAGRAPRRSWPWPGRSPR